MYPIDRTPAADLAFCKCWADASLPSGEPSGESCNRIAATMLGLCAKHYRVIVGRDVHALPRAA